MAELGGVVGRLFTKGSVSEQIFVWAILAGVVQALGRPGLDELQQLANQAAQNTVLTPADLADMVVRAVKGEQEAAAEAARSGLDIERFRALVHNAGEGPGPGDLARALRRGIVPESGTGPESVSFDQGIRESRLKNKWTDTIKALSVEEPTPIEPLEALLEGQLSDDEARALYRRFGGDPEHFTWRFNARGSAPTPIEALEMANRRIIPFEGEGPDATSFHQAFLEGPWRNKWEHAFRELGRHLPPPRTVVALVRAGAIPDEQAAQYLQDAGLSPELAAAYIAEAHHSKTAHQRDLTVAQILDLYEAHALSAEDTTRALGDMGYTAGEAAQLIALRDLQREVKAVNAAVSRIAALYIARKIDQPAAVAALQGFQIPAAQQSELIRIWDLERAVQVKTLTAAEVVAAFHWKIFDQVTAQAELVTQGFTPFDAWALLSIREHTPLPGRPAQ